MKLLFPIVTLANYIQCIQLLTHKPHDWIVDCIVITKGFLATPNPHMKTIARLSNKTYYVDDFKESYISVLTDVLGHDYVIPVWGEPSTELFYPLVDSAKLKSFSKTELYNIAKSLDIHTPTLYNTDIEYPIIAKPIIGSGSLGVKKINNELEFNNFFHKEGIKPHDYFDYGKGYQIEKFIEGDVSTIVGCVINGTVYIGYSYDIESNIDSYFTTTKATLPSKHHLKLDSFSDQIDKLLKALSIDNSPFIFDVIVGDEICLIDFGFRFGGNNLTFDVCHDWMIGAINAINKHSVPPNLEINNTHMMQVLPFDTGKILNYTIDASSADKFIEPSTTTFYSCKNLHNILTRGYVSASGSSVTEAEEKIKYILSTFKIEYEPNTPTNT